MSDTFKRVWGIGAVGLFTLIFLVGVIGESMALSPTGRPPVIDYPPLLGIGAGAVAYWTAICWMFAKLRRNPLVSMAIFVGTLFIALGYPAIDRAVFAMQQAQTPDEGRLGMPPDWSGKTVLMLWPEGDECKRGCWNIATAMEPRVVVVFDAKARAIDFSQAVDLTTLELEEIVVVENTNGATQRRQAQVDTIDYVIIYDQAADDFDGVFDDLRPSSLLRGDFRIDSYIVPVTEQIAFDLAQPAPILRLVRFDRNVREYPYLPGHVYESKWTSDVRDDNARRARGFFCSQASRNTTSCLNAFD